MTIPSTLRVDTALCTACRACELACHYHHTGSFGIVKNSVHVDYDADTSEVAIGFDETCDFCSSEGEPLCAAYCGPGAILVR
jgi:Fe-S-cluster-containing dehydrogenase component